MAHTLEELKKKNVAQLREIAAGLEHEALHGYTTMHKDHLLVALCQALGIDVKEHHAVVGVNKSDIKAQIRELKKRREAVLAAHDHTQLKIIRRTIHRLKRRLHKATV
jgi:hypothetical protein